MARAGTDFFRRIGIAFAVLLALVSAPARAETTLRVVMHSDVKILDPIWTTVYITRNHGYMIYDTLFAMDANGKIQPQMADSYSVSPDGLTYSIKLRDGLQWHDGQPVTAEDCVASIKRWGAKDAIGQKILGLTEELTAADAKTIVFSLKEPTGLLTYALGKPSSNVPFMMPKRIAETDPNKQISEFIGSGPFMLKKDEWRPGDKIVYVKFPGYKPRPEPASGLAGGKVAKVDRIEWIAMTDPQQALNALQKGEVNIVEQPQHDLLDAERLGHVVVAAEGQPGDLVLQGVPCGEEQGRRVDAVGAQAAQQPEAVHAGHHHIEQDDVAGAVGADFQRARAVACGDDLIIFRREPRIEQLHVEREIVDDQDAGGHSGVLNSPKRRPQPFREI